ncbi:GIY-YIG nuclease family protein [Pantoea sp. ACRSB]|jgi:hypothetical protein|uniref:GIY-YIG nuclease family protein n=1 Tax=Pantoea sp. ACRSB TaxID=2918207 RepID=UPI002892C0F1|nr:GIY-YIG nuclease family protein [Pantoea sp. ACRSB]MCG7388785.1 GIY-YIG nuclease family protein [Pantoea sp. ACRSB]
MHLEPIERQHGVLKEMNIPANFRMAGWVYVLSNDFMPDIYKVGMTTTSPEIRAKELSSATGVPAPFKIVAAYHCNDPAQSERDAHEELASYRINESREFFKLEIEELTDACEACCEANVNRSVQDLANDYHIISFEKLDHLNLASLFEDIGLNVFGDKMAIAERLIRLGAERVFKVMTDNYQSLVLNENKAYAIENSDSQFFTLMEEEQARYEAEKLAAGIYGPQLPVDF